MKDTFFIIVLICAIAVSVLLIWNIVLLPRRKKAKNEEYVELKYKQQFYVAVFTTIIAVIAFMGYDKYSEIETTIRADVKKQTDSIITASKIDFDRKIAEIDKVQDKILFQYENLKETNSNLRDNSEQTNDRFYELLNQFIALKKDLVTSEIELQSQLENMKDASQDIKNVRSDIEAIKKIDFLNQVYLVPNRTFEASEVNNFTDTVYFKNLRTINKESLPEFKTPPSVIISNYNTASLMVYKIHTEYLVIRHGGLISWEEEDTYPENWKYDLLIIYKESQ